jgi:hypothetical protein
MDKKDIKNLYLNTYVKDGVVYQRRPSGKTVVGFINNICITDRRTGQVRNKWDSFKYEGGGIQYQVYDCLKIDSDTKEIATYALHGTNSQIKTLVLPNGIRLNDHSLDGQNLFIKVEEPNTPATIIFPADYKFLPRGNIADTLGLKDESIFIDTNAKSFHFNEKVSEGIATLEKDYSIILRTDFPEPKFINKDASRQLN